MNITEKELRKLVKGAYLQGGYDIRYAQYVRSANRHCRIGKCGNKVKLK